MAFQPISASEAIEQSVGADVLPAGAYVCIVTDAVISKSKAGKIALLLTWDVAEGEHAGHFGGAQYGHTEWIMLESKSGTPTDEAKTRGFAAFKLDRISQSNSQPPVTFDAGAIVNRYASQYDQDGRVGQLPVVEIIGRYVGLVVGTVDETYNGSVQHRNEVAGWYTVSEIRTGKYADKNGNIRDIKIPAHKDKTGGAATQPQTQDYAQPKAYQQPAPYAQPAPLASDPIPF